MFRSVEATDAGKYKIQAENELGRTDAEATLSVMHEPRLKAALKDVAVHVGEPIKLEVLVSANPDPVVTWKKNGAAISDGGRVHMRRSAADKFELTIANAKLDDAADYRASLTNSKGELSTHCKARLMQSLHRSKCLLP